MATPSVFRGAWLASSYSADLGAREINNGRIDMFADVCCNQLDVCRSVHYVLAGRDLSLLLCDTYDAAVIQVDRL